LNLNEYRLDRRDSQMVRCESVKLLDRGGYRC